MKKILYLIILISAQALGQDAGEVNWMMDEKINFLLDKKLELDKAKPAIAGFRVQLYYGANRAEALDLKSKFSALFPDIDSYLIYQQPYFRLRAGNFRSRYEAHQLLKKVENDFPSVFIVNDEIAFPKLLTPELRTE
jgi:hypothetical protein